MSYIQRIGRSLMIPIAVMPAAALLFRFGKIDFENPLLQKIAVIFEAGGGAIFDHLPLLFAIGIAIGLTDGKGVSALSAAVGYTVFQEVMRTFEVAQTNDLAETNMQMGVLGGLITGVVTSYLYNRFKNIKLPQALGFFAGSRFVPIITALSMTVLGGLLGFIWMPIQEKIQVFSLWLESTGGIGTLLYGTINRLLIPTGLHHIVNHIAWFQIGEFSPPGGKLVQGDLTRFFAGDPTAGAYMTGFFPIMMFGLPGAALAMAMAAKPEHRKVILSIMLSAALTSFLTGITEPIEFAFMLVAPALFVIHAVLTGLSMMLMYMLEVKMGFGFSAGFIDLAINWNDGTKPWLIFPIGLACFAVYYFTFYAVIRLFNLATPGRTSDAPRSESGFAADAALEGPELGLAAVSAIASSQGFVPSGDSGMMPPQPVQAAAPEPAPVSAIRSASAETLAKKAGSVIGFIGGEGNISDVDACITRLRLRLKQPELVQTQALKDLGAAGILRVGRDNVHVVFGTDSELIKEEIQKLLTQNAK
ncbi:PTS transporter subunit EIIC [Paenibacillus sp. LHD-117]|uniref:PTS transporter subunit EIIC n=1 Tax=Paenibacillus sp. LHD-117 TaxID=3071412 RepID=UPI0027E1E7EC|nr:PTS transporter subunit EIIC [Paenibacillus sp. LHD-117]MDQ6419502.1 PTS transporter subunit EIIC [Paenibacillus sp. LHD-117]